MMDERESVVAAAWKTDSGEVVVGKRHNNARDIIVALGKTAGKAESDQGFITSSGRFVDRKEAFEMQKSAGIESVDRNGYHGKELHSEDLY